MTPTGDDYLVGALAVLSLSGSPLLPTLAAAVRAHAAATTTVGRHFLLAAADGRFHHDVTLAATAALTGSATAERDYARLAELGSTSGTDTLTGIHDTLVVAAPAPGKDLS